MPGDIVAIARIATRAYTARGRVQRTGVGTEVIRLHDDLHSANICWADGAGPRVIDWGDTVVGHPFGTMLATLNSIAWHAEIELDDPRVLRVREAYLDVFADTGTAEERRHWVTLARRTGCVSRALSYERALVGEPAEAEADLDWPVRGWLLELLEDAD